MSHSSIQFLLVAGTRERISRQKNRVMGPAGPGPKTDSASEGQQQSNRNRKPALAGTNTSKLLMRTSDPVKNSTFAGALYRP
jgi:hypothetical protein